MTEHSSPAIRSLSHVSDWVFDLDNTLYPRECNLWSQIDVRITAYVMEVTQLEFDAARELQKGYYRDFGTTLNGLMQRHKVDPQHFLKTVHAIDYSPVAAHPDLIDAIKGLPGRKFILTNADSGHARSVLSRLGGEDLFDGIFDICAMDYTPKPHQSAYDAFLSTHGIDPARAAMFDDLEKNLLVPHQSGMATVQVIASEGYADERVDPWELAHAGGPHVHHITSSLTSFLRNLP
ncbi:pyrimidine 5'-nucleotidase [Paradevosia shaoguanensis]|uniref:pyrimidine 5'-nucleotidase n=1 Tax=Paradevosia shaoguanensis TaxID=1335043 RepID=UPI0015FD4178|nr:pyrimidine 5'-nucleotidase [Devosia sp. D6-9]